MRKTLAAGLAALTFGGAVAASAIPAAAEAHDYRGGYHNYGGYYRGGNYGNYYHHRNNSAGPAIIAGIAGLAIGAALADSGHRSYDRSYYSGSYYSGGYGYAPSYGYGPSYGYDSGYGYGYRTCQSSRWVWDPYIGRRVLVTSNYAC